MQIYHHLNEFPVLEKPILTLGTFDGVHVGHQKVLAKLKSIAANVNGSTVLMTFDPHPRKVLYPENQELSLLSTLDEKIKLLEQSGVQHLIINPFTIEFSKLEHEAFVRDILVNKIRVNTLVVGYDHQFGHDRKGSFKELYQMAPKYGFNVEEIPEQDIDEIKVSSTRIRKDLKSGKIEEANHLLGYEYQLTGIVVEGNKVGRKLGFPTANLALNDPDKLVPVNGIYAVMTEVKDKMYKGVLSIGNRPTFDNGARSIEVNIFDFNVDIYGEKLTLTLKNYLRPELKFESAEALIHQMEKDKLLSMELLRDVHVQ